MFLFRFPVITCRFCCNSIVLLSWYSQFRRSFCRHSWQQWLKLYRYTFRKLPGQRMVSDQETILKDKIDSADIWVTTSAINKVGSNGLLQGVDALPSGKVRYRWKTNYPMNYYMPSISVGNYMEYLNYAKPLAMSPDSILIQHYLVDNVTYFNSVKANLDKTPAFIEKLSELFGLYPFKNEKYGHAHASIGGGMEHQTMSTMNSFGSTLIAHELGASVVGR